MGNFSDAVIAQVWEMAKIPDEGIKDKRRKDYAGAWINRDQYGNSN